MLKDHYWYSADIINSANGYIGLAKR